MLVLHQFLISPFCDKIRRIMHWKGLEYEVEEYPLVARKKIRRIYPTAKLPCLEHDGTYIGDSTDIAYYLEETFPEKPLLPSTPRERGLVHVLEDWADESLYFYEMYLRFGLPHNAKRNLPRMLHADRPLVRRILPHLIPRGIRGIFRTQGVGRKSLEHVLRDVRRQLLALKDCLGSGEFLVGDQLSLADIAVYCMVCAMWDSAEGSDIIRELPTLGAWMKRVEDATGEPVAGSWERD